MYKNQQSNQSDESGGSSNRMLSSRSLPSSQNKRRPQSNYVLTVGASNPQCRGNAKSNRSASPLEGLVFNFWIQMKTWDNAFFLAVILLEMWVGVSESQAMPLTALPFFILVFVRMFFEYFRERELEALARPTNEWKYSAFRKDRFNFLKGHRLRVGDVIQVEPLTEVPADCVFLFAKSDLQYCFVGTSNLDGNLSPVRKETPDLGSDLLSTNYERIVKDLQGAVIHAEHPNPDLFSWEGVLDYKGQKIPLNVQNLLPANSFLRSNSTIYAVVVYSGNDCKSQRLAPVIRQKNSRFVEFTHKVHKAAIGLVLALSLLCTLVNMIILLTDKDRVSSWFLFERENVFYNLFSHWGGWVIILSRLVPMNCSAALSIGQYYQAKNAKNRLKGVAIEGFTRKGYPKKLPRNRVINHRAIENLGQVDLMMVNKTGTLTSFEEAVEKMRCANQLYDEGFEEEESLLSVRNNILVKNMSEDSDLGQKTRELLRAMALCNNVSFSLGLSDHYVGTSPEEIAFCNYARKYGAILTNTQDRDKTKTLDENFGEISMEGSKDFHILTQFGFDSLKERSSIVFLGKGESSERRVLIYSRGSVRGMKATMARSSEPDFEVGVAKLRKDRGFGFKCSIFAKKEMSIEQFVRMVKGLDPDVLADVDRENPISSLRKMLTTVSQVNTGQLRRAVESDLDFLGSACTKEFMEKQLHETLDFFAKAGIETWIVSEDSVNMCIYLCRRLNLVGAQSQTKIVMTMDHPDDLSPNSINNFKTRIEAQRDESKKFCLAVSGVCLEKVLKMEDSNPSLYSDFLAILFSGGITIFGGLNPLQKKKLVDLYRKEYPEKVVLAVGDGPQDQLMLSSAHLGVNVFKGQQYLSCRSADVYLQKFHQLRTLLFGFGVEASRKSSSVFLLSLYSSVLLVVPELVTAPFSYFFPRRLLPDWISSVVGLVLPVLGMVLFQANDKVFDHQQMIKCSGVYEPSRKQVYWSWKAIIKTAGNALVSGIVVTLLGLALFDLGTYKDGQFFGWFSFGNMVTLAIMILLCGRIFWITNTFSFFLLMVPLGMMLIYFFMWLLMSFISGSNLFDSFMEVVLSPQLYIFVLVVCCLAVAEGLFMKIEFFSILSELDLKETFEEGGVKLKNPKFQSESDGLYNKSGQEDLMKDDYQDSDSDSD